MALGVRMCEIYKLNNVILAWSGVTKSSKLKNPYKLTLGL